MSTFRIGFDGPSVDNGEIDVAGLAPSLLALGDPFEAANSRVEQRSQRGEAKIKMSEKGNFIALLSLDVSLIADMLDMGCRPS